MTHLEMNISVNSDEDSDENSDEDSDEDSDENSDEDSDENSDEDSDYRFFSSSACASLACNSLKEIAPNVPLPPILLLLLPVACMSD